MAEPVPDAPLRALGRRRKGEQVANILWPTPAMPSVSYGIPRACRGTCCALVWYRRGSMPRDWPLQGAPDRPDDALWVNERYGLFSTVEQFDRTKPRGV